jgi:hypothetical protein
MMGIEYYSKIPCWMVMRDGKLRLLAVRRNCKARQQTGTHHKGIAIATNIDEKTHCPPGGRELLAQLSWKWWLVVARKQRQ